ncbi:bifunctional riboflavin kinase/FAD synthetase [Effusibacillus dendaii]|uniref:Riboflavin biosynthesis protein n=1 Tax=Effusibacillus dendaii TaxID=2743772 RepID=A0A7I8D9W3_9BACL|nr:bifunctional riboflavin kinase/FAD synthetase [Effusibacillus dendaii]BCJ85310.1 riboflavin biosynthesis protein [Effusibacillus dendaii]
MKTVRIDHTASEWPLEPSVLALGNFDGVHKGHRQIIEDARQLALARGLKLAVMTFDPHPRQVLGAGANYDQQLTPLPVKLKIFQELEVDICYVVHFNKEFSCVSAQSFVDEYLLRSQAEVVVAGFDYRFGKGGSADVTRLKALMERAGRQVHVVSAVNLYGEKVSSSFIREKLLLGEVKLAADLLGKYYEVTGTVVHGEARGRLLGFPTANVEPSYKFVLPRAGVYLVRVHLTDSHQVYDAVMNIGMKPTFQDDEKKISLEAHLLDWSGDLYNQNVKIEFLDFIRSERKFSSAEELVQQIRSDVQEAKRRLVRMKS